MKTSRESEVVLDLGSSRTVTVQGGFASVTSTARDIVGIKDLGHGQYLVVGNSEGRGDVVVTQDAGTRNVRHISVVKWEPDGCAWKWWLRWLTPESRRFPEILLEHADGGEHFAVSGEVDSAADYARLYQARDAFPAQWEFRIRLKGQADAGNR
jgi:hypothetical protein